jgi:hypothetical protein
MVFATKRAPRKRTGARLRGASARSQRDRHLPIHSLRSDTSRPRFARRLGQSATRTRCTRLHPHSRMRKSADPKPHANFRYARRKGGNHQEQQRRRGVPGVGGFLASAGAGRAEPVAARCFPLGSELELSTCVLRTEHMCPIRTREPRSLASVPCLWAIRAFAVAGSLRICGIGNLCRTMGRCLLRTCSQQQARIDDETKHVQDRPTRSRAYALRA